MKKVKALCINNTNTYLFLNGWYYITKVINKNKVNVYNNIDVYLGTFNRDIFKTINDFRKEKIKYLTG